LFAVALFKLLLLQLESSRRKAPRLVSVKFVLRRVAIVVCSLLRFCFLSEKSEVVIGKERNVSLWALVIKVRRQSSSYKLVARTFTAYLL
jgi:hypothetical protein